MKKYLFLCAILSLGCKDWFVVPFYVTTPFLKRVKIVPLYPPIYNASKDVHIGDSIWIAVDEHNFPIACDTSVSYPKQTFFIESSGMFSQYKDTVFVTYQKGVIVWVNDR